MECPTPCYLCGEIFALDQLQFFTDYCRCDSWVGGGCTHGLCSECNSAYSDVSDDDDEGE